MSISQESLAQNLGQVIPFSINAGFLALSYAISLVGAGSTLELINRRTSRKGIYNHLLLLGAAISMGGVAIWSMHFIGNRAISLLNGEPELQIAYSISITAASLFVPIVVLLVAFFAVSTTNTISWWRVGLSGSLSGCAICGMHYLGDASISNYRCSYAVPNVVGAALIAVAASTVALSLFFVFKAAWAISWWRRVGCAIVLAGAVSGMHWCAAMGTSYTLQHLNSSGGDGSRNTTAILVICLSVGACFVMAGTAIYTAQIRKGYASKAQRIALAAAVFDWQGRILVTPDGLLPSEEITDKFLQKSHNDIFSTAHPLFHWVFQASRNWSSIANFIEDMSDHVARFLHGEHDSRMGTKPITGNDQLVGNYDIIFRELFCLAAAALAVKMRGTLADAGILWDEILTTGAAASFATRSRTKINNNMDAAVRQSNGIADITQISDDLAEKGLTHQHQEYGQGCLMFLVRRVGDTRVAEKLEASGYCFAELHQVVNIISSTMQIKTQNLERRLRTMAAYAQDTMLDRGVHVGLFAVRARLDHSGFDVLVRTDARNLLPSVQLPLERLEQWQMDFLRDLNGLSLRALLQISDHTKDRVAQKVQFASQLSNAIKDLRNCIDDPTFDDATLIPGVFQVPCRPLAEMHRPLTCSLITFRLVLPIHASISTSKCEFIPLQLFKIHQLVYENSSHHAAFARSVHRELSPILTSLPLEQPPRPSSNRKPFMPLRGSPMMSFRRLARLGTSNAQRHHFGGSRERLSTTLSEHSSSSIRLYRRNSAEDDLTLHLPRSKPSFEDSAMRPAKLRRQQQQQPSLFGGIMVSQEVTIDVQEASHLSGMTITPQETYKAAHRQTPTATLRRKNQASAGGEEDRVLDGKAEKSNSGGKAGLRNSAIELKYITTMPNMGLSNVEVRKDDEAATFVDELLAGCMDKRN